MTATVQKTIWLVTRHPGALEWLLGQVDLRHTGFTEVAHLDAETVQPEDLVVGTLPVHLIATLCERGARYLHITFDMPESRRGQELSAADLALLNARLVEFRAQAVDAGEFAPLSFAALAIRDLQHLVLLYSSHRNPFRRQPS